MKPTETRRCFVQLAKPARANYAFAQFSDGKVYRLEPVTDEDVFSHMANPTRPGDWFNNDLKKRPGFAAKRLKRFPLMASTGWIFVRYAPEGVLQALSVHNGFPL
jgi:hypothetical protein